MSIQQAKAAHAAAKQAFADNPSPANTKTLVAAAEAVQAAEIEQSKQETAKREQAARAFAIYQAAEAHRIALNASRRARLVELDREASGLIAAISATVKESLSEYHQAKQLSLDLDRDTILKPPPTIMAQMGDLQRQLGAAQMAEKRNGHDAVVSTWLTPAFPWPTTVTKSA